MVHVNRYRRVARAVQRLSGRGYQESLREVESRLDEISALKKVYPDKSFVSCVVEVCFESPAELRSRWGDIFPVKESA